MVSARRNGASASYHRHAVRGLCVRYASAIDDHLPESGVRPKREIEARNGLDEVRRDPEDRRRHVGFPGEEEDVWEQPREGLPGPEGLDGVSVPVTEKIDPDERRGAILSRQREL